jgi:AraC family transcriptional regulator of adaptative response/methylated-DNA-[protein]-cysteine methyltransferase
MSPTERWQAVMARDRRFDGAFVYAVRSTGIYCRPSCASRRPRRTQVSFFPIPEAAEREGFRACRRCHPADANGSDPVVALVREACRAIAAGERPGGGIRAGSHAPSSASWGSRREPMPRRAASRTSSRN